MSSTTEHTDGTSSGAAGAEGADPKDPPAEAEGTPDAGSDDPGAATAAAPSDKKTPGASDAPESPDDEAAADDADVKAEADAAPAEEAAPTGEAAPVAKADAPVEAAPSDPPSAETKPKTGGSRRSPGERLAAARAAKAAAKAAQRGRTAEAVESRAEQKAAQASGWLRERTQLLLGIAVVALVVVGGVAFWRGQAESAAADASASLYEAVETAQAPIREEGIEDDSLLTRETYASASDRAEKALERFRAVTADGPAGVWARLGEGTAALDLGQPEAARKAFEGALADGGDDPVVAWRALEGIAFSYEAEQAWDEALGRLEELETVADGAYEPIAAYHAARMRLAKGDRAQARNDLQQLLADLPAAGGGPGPDEGGGDPNLDYVRSQAQRLLDSLGGGAADPADAAEGVRRALEELRNKTTPGAGDAP